MSESNKPKQKQILKNERDIWSQVDTQSHMLTCVQWQKRRTAEKQEINLLQPAALWEGLSQHMAFCFWISLL